jgi:hypothetical protein
MHISKEYEKTILFEHRFWLQILGNHANFIINILSPSEMERIEKAKIFKNTFNRFLDKTNKNISGNKLDDFTVEALRLSKKFRSFNLELAREHISPILINHMLKEVEEYINKISKIIQADFVSSDSKVMEQNIV